MATVTTGPSVQEQRVAELGSLAVPTKEQCEAAAAGAAQSDSPLVFELRGMDKKAVACVKLLTVEVRGHVVHTCRVYSQHS